MQRFLLRTFAAVAFVSQVLLPLPIFTYTFVQDSGDFSLWEKSKKEKFVVT